MDTAIYTDFSQHIQRRQAVGGDQVAELCTVMVRQRNAGFQYQVDELPPGPGRPAVAVFIPGALDG